MEVERSYRIVNQKGLHARASAKFVATVERFDSKVEVTRQGRTAAGDSIMGLLMLAAAKGAVIEVRMTGEDAGELAEALEELISGRFGEEF